jgi:hypothetical protein
MDAPNESWVERKCVDFQAGQFSQKLVLESGVCKSGQQILKGKMASAGETWRIMANHGEVLPAPGNGKEKEMLLFAAKQRREHRPSRSGQNCTN